MISLQIISLFFFSNKLYLFSEEKINRNIYYYSSFMEGHKIKTKSKFKVRHQKHKVFRANDPLLSVLMWGVNFTVSNNIYFQ
jgi:hypothetical protein